MRIYYQGTDITDTTQVHSCIVRDTARERCDSLEVRFENAALWQRWGPQTDDKIIVAHDGYDSGIQYVNTARTEDGRFCILATSLPCSAREKGWASYTGLRLENILRACAAASGMDWALYGVDGGTLIPYIQREDEGCAAFLHRLLLLEGAALKCVNGRYAAIGIDYAQKRGAAQTLQIDAKQSGTLYTTCGQRWRTVSIKAPGGSAVALDSAVPAGRGGREACGVPVVNDIQAGRWARGLLLDHNRRCEALKLNLTYTPAFTALARVDVSGGTDADGEWLIEDVEHDLIQLTTRITMHRCISTIQ